MSINNKNNIFYGVTISKIREIIADEIISENPEKFIHPCVGRFTIVEIFNKKGGDNTKVESSDILIYSSIIGYLADTTKNFEDLKIKLSGEIQPKTNNPIDVASAALIQLKYNQIKGRSQYEENIRRELLYNKEKYIGEMKEKLSILTDNLKGIKYDIRDLWEVIEENENKESHLMFLNPPTVSGNDYEKMYTEENIIYYKPEIKFITAKDRDRLIDRLYNCKCKVIIGVNDTEQGIKQYEGWNVIATKQHKKGKYDYILTNYQKKDRKTYAIKPFAKKLKTKKYPIFDDSDITPKSKIMFVPVGTDTAMYYRELFVHKFGVTKAEDYFLFTIDGKVVSVTGLTYEKIFHGGDYVIEIFGITKTSKRYKKLSKLFIMCLVSKEMQNLILTRRNFGINKVNSLQTTHIATYKGGADRGIMKQIRRDKMPDGRYKLILKSEFKDVTFKEVLNRWVQLNETRWKNV